MAGKSGRTLVNTPDKSLRSRIMSWETMLIVLFVAVNIYCMSLSPTYQVGNVFREMPKYLTEIFLLLPMAFILLMGDIDISVGSTVCLSATVACLASNAGLPFPLVILIALGMGTLCGFINGFIVTTFTELPPMIVTLGTQILFRGIAEILLGSGGSLSLTNPAGFTAIAGRLGIIPYILFLVLIFAVGFTVTANRTTFGRKLYAIGSNKLAAKFAGIKVEKIRLIVFTLTGLMAGLSALFLTAALYGVNTTTASGFEMDAIAMAVFGGISTNGGKGKLQGGIIAAFIIICLRVGLGQINMNPQIILIILGILLILAVMLPNVFAKIKKKRSAARIK